MTTDFNDTGLKTLNDLTIPLINNVNVDTLRKELMKYIEYLESDKGCNCFYCAGQRNFIEYFLGLWDGK